MLKELIIAGCGGFVGTAGRYLIGRFTSTFWSGSFPLSTFIVNILGCFLMGLFLGLLENSKTLTPQHSLLLLTGFCGGFTTFSTFSADMLQLISKGNWLLFAIYLGLSILLGIASVWAGRAIIR